MARGTVPNPEHEAVVRKGKEAVSIWRSDHPEVPLDLSYASLDDLDLAGFDLSCSRFHETSFRRAKLAGASLELSDILEVDFRGSDLNRINMALCHVSGMQLEGASLRGSDLSFATIAAHWRDCDLRDLDLSYTRLAGSEMTNVDLSGSYCYHTVFADLDLSGARGLEAVHVGGPCSVGVDTILKSHGRISREFLENCGVPNRTLEVLLSSATATDNFESVFISHSDSDSEFCSRLLQHLRDAGIQVWYSNVDMRGGRRSLDQVLEAIASHDRCVLVLSESSMASEWVKTELKAAVRRESQNQLDVLFPIRLVGMDLVSDWTCFDPDSGRDLAAFVRSYHVADFEGWSDPSKFNVAANKLVDALRKTTTHKWRQTETHTE